MFRERETRDELGLGTIRDAISDLLFPGVSTIQTRIAYMLLIPWVYRLLESRGTPSNQAADAARNLELQLTERLIATEGKEAFGIFGMESGRNLQRLPSSVYWAGLQSWGIRVYPNSQDQYHRDFDQIHKRRHRARLHRDHAHESGDDYASLFGISHETWHLGLPDMPDQFPNSATFSLTREQSDYLCERIQHAQPGTLLAHLVLRPMRVQCQFPWEHPLIGTFPSHLREQMHHASCFSLLLNGASLLYNLQLAELKSDQGLVASYQTKLDTWGDTIDCERDELVGWAQEPARFWSTVEQKAFGPIAMNTQTFVEQWTSVALKYTRTIAGSGDARDLVRGREISKKRAHSRFTNERMLQEWQGASGTARLNFRWPTVRTYLADLAMETVGRSDV